MVKISVIMPVYNVDKYLAKSIDSVLNQDFSDFELILVDDGSTDSSASICDKYEKTDKRVKVIHQKNSGAHTARNNALKIASGKYVCFFDSDDYVNADMLSDLYDVAEKNDSELVISGFYIDTYYDDSNYVKFDYVPYTRDNAQVEHCDKDTFRKYAYLNFDRNMFYPPWNKLYKMSYLIDNNITFPLTYRDDFPFVLSVIRDINKVTYTKKQYYNFVRKRAESETQKFIFNLYEKREEEHAQMLELYKYWGLLDDKNSFEMIARRYIDRLIECMVNLFNDESNLTKTEKIDLISSYLNTNNYNTCISKSRPHNLYLKIMYLILKSKNSSLCYTMSKFISSIKKKHIKQFSLLKFNR